MNEVGVLLTPRAPGGHETALLGWLADAVRDCGLQVQLFAPGPALAGACAAAGLPTRPCGDTCLQLLRAVHDWPRERPLLLAPGVLHADARLLAAAVLLRRRVWVYVPMAHTAVCMRYRLARLRDRLLAPWLRRVESWITLDGRQARLLTQGWHIEAPVHLLPNRARLPAGEPPTPAPAADGRLRVAFVGRFEAWQKGLDWLVATLRTEPEWTRRFHWRFQGRGPAELALQELASTLGPQHVQVAPYAPIDAALAASDVLLLVSRYEGLPLVALEATARGWPVVATRDSGLQDLLPAEALFDFGDAAGMRRALDQLQTPAQRSRAVAIARRHLQQLCDPAAYDAALCAVVQALRGQAGSTC